MSVDFTLIIPEFVLAGTAFAVLLVDLVLPAGLEHRRNALTASAAAAMIGQRLKPSAIAATTASRNVMEVIRNRTMARIPNDYRSAAGSS